MNQIRTDYLKVPEVDCVSYDEIKAAAPYVFSDLQVAHTYFEPHSYSENPQLQWEIESS